MSSTIYWGQRLVKTDVSHRLMAEIYLKFCNITDYFRFLLERAPRGLEHLRVSNYPTTPENEPSKL